MSTLGCDHALIPLQVRLARVTRALPPEADDLPDGYWRLERRWMVWGLLATVLPLANLYFMVFKPT